MSELSKKIPGQIITNLSKSLLNESDTIRFWNKVDSTDIEGCWKWTGNKNQKGRGRFWIGKKSETAPRVAMKTVGIDPIGMFVLHRDFCHNPGCVRPSHLYLGNQSLNMRDAVAAGTHNMSRKTHCPYEHEYNKENTTVNCNGSRVCRICSRRKWAEARDRGWKRTPKKELK